MQADQYPFLMRFDTEEDGYVLTAIDLPGCSAAGYPMGKAVIAFHQAIEDWIEAQTKAGNPIPVPSGQVQPAYVPGQAVKNDLKRMAAEIIQLRGDLDVERGKRAVGSIMVRKGTSPDPRVLSVGFGIGTVEETSEQALDMMLAMAKEQIMLAMPIGK